MKLTSIKTWTLALALTGLTTGVAVANDELDGAPGNLPKGLVLRVDNTTGATTVFKADKAVTNDDDAAEVAATAAGGESVNVIAASELDRDSSKEAWVYWHNPRGYYHSYYSYYNYGYYYNYQPYYQYSYYNYSYYYYWYRY